MIFKLHKSTQILRVITKNIKTSNHSDEFIRISLE